MIKLKAIINHIPIFIEPTVKVQKIAKKTFPARVAKTKIIKQGSGEVEESNKIKKMTGSKHIGNMIRMITVLKRPFSELEPDFAYKRKSSALTKRRTREARKKQIQVAIKADFLKFIVLLTCWC